MIPIVFSSGTDPIAAGMVASFNRPRSNATGIVQFNNELIAKRLEMLHEMVPKAAIIGLLVDPSPVTESRTAAVQSAVRVIGQQIRVIRVTSQEQFDAAFATMVQEQVGALLVPNSTVFTNNRERLVALAARYQISRVRARRRGNGGRKPKVTPAKLLLAQHALGKKGTVVADLCNELGISSQTLLSPCLAPTIGPGPDTGRPPLRQFEQSSTIVG
jgi:hypothetical protein